MEAISTGKVLSRSSLNAQIGSNLVGFGHPAKGCPPCRKNTIAFHYGLGVDVFGPWIAQNKFFSGSSATVGYLPAKKLTITVEVTYLPQAFNRQGDYKDASVTTFKSLANFLAPNTLPKLP
jgi:hypothetical protein